MQTSKINWINLGLAGVILLLIVLAFFFKVMRPSSIDVIEKASEKPILPKGAFTLPLENYEAIGPKFLSLKFSPMALQVPDLKRYLIYYGKNDRPDADLANLKLNFGFNGVKGTVSAKVKEPIYLMYDKNDPKVKYKFSPDNAVTTLWFEASGGTSEAIVSASMRNEAGEVVHEPITNAEFTLKERPPLRSDADDRRIGDFKVDGTLLSRQGAKWYGIDKFMERHGGEEYKDTAQKQRIDFGTDDNSYSVYVGPDSYLAWVNGRWREMKPGKDSVKYPLLGINKIEDRIMKLDFWDVDGQAKISLNLIKSMEAWIPQSIQKEFSFIGARTRSQFLFEINKERMTLSPLDWILRTEKGWKKLTTVQDIDDYVERKITGPLFVFDGVEKRDGKQVLLGTLFNKTRTEIKSIEVPMQQGASLSEPKKEKKQAQSNDVETEDPDADAEDIQSDASQNFEQPIDSKVEKLKEKMIERLKDRGVDTKDNPVIPGALRK
jgi:hypothetical protein